MPPSPPAKPPIAAAATSTGSRPSPGCPACAAQACLDPNSTYICTPCGNPGERPRCFIIQKISTGAASTTTIANLVSGTPTVSAAASTAASDGSSTTGDDASSEASMPGSLSLNPLADVFRSKNAFWSSGCVYMNGDIGKLPSGAVYSTTPENLPLAAPVPNTDYSSLNGVSEVVDSYSSATSPEGEAVPVGGGGGAGGTLGASAPGPGPVPASNPSATNVPASTPGPLPSSTLEIPLEQLKQLLSSQLEYYFSRENLANDTYLLSQMDNDQYVPIWTVANFNQVKKLTNDIKLITEVLRESPNVQVDEEGQKVRPNHKRCIVILREIPDNTPLEEVKNLFSGEGCPRLISCEFAHNSSWYVTFESDEDAQRAYRFLREEVREFQGKPIMARIKAKARLPMAPVASVVAGSALGPMKNGYRTPPPGPATPATPSSGAMYDPSAAGVAAAYQNSPQRFLFTNGTHLPPSVNYGNQVQIYTFQQHHFFPPGIMQPWPPNASYFDIGNVFSVNGLSQQGSFPKPPGSRYNVPRGNRNRRNQASGDRGHMSDTGMSRHSLSHHHHTAPIVSAATKSSNIGSSKGQHMVPSAAGDMAHHPHSRSHGSSGGSGVVTDGGDLGSEDGYRQGSKDPLPPRHRRRRKDDEVPGGLGGPPGRGTPLLGKPSTPAGGSGNPQPLAHSGSGAHSAGSTRTGPQFDLEPNAFPPLPGLDGTAAGTVTTKTSSAPEASTHLPDASPAQSHWENRLADVVKGTAKSKPPSSYSSASSVSSSTKDKEVGHSPPASPAPASTPALTPAPAPAPTPAPTTPGATTTTPASSSAIPATTSSSAVATTAPAVSTVSTSTSVASTATETSAPVVSPGPLPTPVVSVGTSTTDAATQQQQTSQTAAAAAATTTTTDSASATVATPPTSPEKVVPVAKTCSTADKSTKTDESLLDSEERPRGTTATEAVATQGTKQQTVTAASVAAKPVPTTTNAATMTSSVMTEASFTGTTATCSTASQAASSPPPTGEPVRLSYAQVAQHHKEKAERMQREEKEAVSSSTNTSSTASSRVSGQSHGEPRERDFRDGPTRYSGRGPNSSNGSGSGRQERGGFRRRDGPVRYRDSRDGGRDGRGEPRERERDRDREGRDHRDSRDGRDGRDGGRGDGRDSRETLHPRSPK